MRAPLVRFHGIRSGFLYDSQQDIPQQQALPRPRSSRRLECLRQFRHDPSEFYLQALFTLEPIAQILARHVIHYLKVALCAFPGLNPR